MSLAKFDPRALTRAAGLTVLIAGLGLFVGQGTAVAPLFRYVAVGTILFGLFLMLIIRPGAGLFGVTLWLPLMAFVRRWIYSISLYTSLDPILLVVPLLSVVLFLQAAFGQKEAFWRAARATRFTQLATAILFMFAVQIVNPLQGGITVGFGGALFFLVPLLWFFFGLLYLDDRSLDHILFAAVIMGVVTGAYGIYQLVFGFLDFEIYALKAAGFNSLFVGQFVRSFSTFSNAEEWSRYLVLSGGVAAGYLGFSPNKVPWAVAFGLVAFFMVMSGVRSSLFGLLTAILIVGAIRVIPAKDFKQFSQRLLLVALLPLAALVVMPGGGGGGAAADPQPAAEQQAGSAMEAMAAHTSDGVSNPLGSDTFTGRLAIWGDVFTKTLPRYPLGKGLGSTTLAASKFAGSDVGPTESYLISIFVNSGLVGGLLMLGLVGYSMKAALQVVFTQPKTRARAASVAGLIIGLWVNNLFGNTYTLYAIAPFGWLLVGWVARQQALLENPAGMPPLLGQTHRGADTRQKQMTQLAQAKT